MRHLHKDSLYKCSSCWGVLLGSGGFLIQTFGSCPQERAFMPTAFKAWASCLFSHGRQRSARLHVLHHCCRAKRLVCSVRA